MKLTATNYFFFQSSIVNWGYQDNFKPVYTHLFLFVWIFDYLQESLAFVRIFLKSFLSVRVSSFCENLSESLLFMNIFLYLSCLWESLPLCKSLWISYYLWSSVGISSFCENLFESLLIFDRLYESMSLWKWGSVWMPSFCYQKQIMIFCWFRMSKADLNNSC